MYNSPIPFTKNHFNFGYYINVKEKETGLSFKLYRTTYSALLECLGDISTGLIKFNSNIDTNIFIEYFTPSFEYYTSNVNLLQENKISLEQKYNAPIMWKTSGNR